MTTAVPARWTSTTALTQIAEWCLNARRLAILTHAKPDGDAIGSATSMARALNLKASREPGDPRGPLATCLFSGPIPTWRDAVLRRDEQNFVGDLTMLDAARYDRFLVVDTGSWSQLEYAKGALQSRAGDIAVIDHHAHGDPDLSARRVIDTSWAAVCQASADFCKLVLGLDSHMKLPLDVATPIYLGLATDTGWFRHSNVTPQVMHLACLLLHAGVEPAMLYASIEQQDNEARPRLLGRALNSMELLAGGKIALSSISMKDFADCRAEQADVHGFTDPMLSIASVRVAVVLTETQGPPNPLTKASFRSKSTLNTVDVNAVAQTLGGGGHKQAAGAKIWAPLAEAQVKMKQVLAGIAFPD